MSQQRPFITCHVLDTTGGKPASGIEVTLKLVSPSNNTQSHQWSAKTNDDGRVTGWSSSPTTTDLNEVVSKLKTELGDGEQMCWALVFATEEYFGKGKTFWPTVQLHFVAERDQEHYHVPLLLSPWSYTTYRGS